MFEGEYEKGERNGKGKEYDAIGGKLEFEGEYLGRIQFDKSLFDKIPI